MYRLMESNGWMMRRPISDWIEKSLEKVQNGSTWISMDDDDIIS